MSYPREYRELLILLEFSAGTLDERFFNVKPPPRDTLLYLGVKVASKSKNAWREMENLEEVCTDVRLGIPLVEGDTRRIPLD